MKLHLFHNWSKWEISELSYTPVRFDPETGKLTPMSDNKFIKRFKKRACKTCGKEQEREVRE